MMFFWLFNRTFLIYDLPCKTILLLEVQRQASDVSPIFFLPVMSFDLASSLSCMHTSAASYRLMHFVSSKARQRAASELP